MATSEEKKEAKPTKIRLTVTIPTRDTVVDALKKMFPMLEIVVEEEKPAEAPAEETSS